MGNKDYFKDAYENEVNPTEMNTVPYEDVWEDDIELEEGSFLKDVLDNLTIEDIDKAYASIDSAIIDLDLQGLSNSKDVTVEMKEMESNEIKEINDVKAAKERLDKFAIYVESLDDNATKRDLLKAMAQVVANTNEVSSEMLQKTKAVFDKEFGENDAAYKFEEFVKDVKAVENYEMAKETVLDGKPKNKDNGIDL